MPFNYKNGLIKIFRTGNWQVLLTKCGLHIWWNGKSSAIVNIPPSYRNQLSGICGNCNGNGKDDFVTKEGKDVSSYPVDVRNKYIGDSYVLPNEASSNVGM